MNSRFLFLVVLWMMSCPAVFAAGEKPNVILIMVDDMGFSDLGYQGGEIETPNLDALARGGVRFSQFYNAGRCCPTRATLMTGLHPHETGIGWMTSEPDRERGEGAPPAYQGNLNERCVTLAEILREAGYGTYMTGKWHLGQSQIEDRPLQRGFDRYYGCLSGATRFFAPTGSRGITLDNDSEENPESTTDRPFYTTDAFTDHAIEFLDGHTKAKRDDPFFLYLAYTAPHWPLQAHEEEIAKYRGKYRDGWDKLREARYRRQVGLGLIDRKWPISPKTTGIPDWDSLDEKTRDEMDLKMAIYAAMVDRVDQNVGKLVTFLKEKGVYENTLILFLSDNGACQEGGMLGRGEFRDVEKRNLEHDNSYGEAWANAGSTPFRFYKHYLYEGGAATPFFMHWPAGIQPREDWYGDPAQLIDLMPTLMDVAGASYPADRKGEKPLPLDGISLRPAFTGGALERGKPLFAEHETNASVREGNWKLVGESVAMPGGTQAKQWELYDLAADRTELHNLAVSQPGKVKELAGKWEAWAARVGVYPRAEGQPSVKKQEVTAEANPPQVGGRPFTLSVTVRSPKPHGVAIAHGGNQFGYALHFVEGRPVFSVRKAGKLTELSAPDPVKGRVTVSARLDAEVMTLAVDGKEVASIASPGLLEKQPAKGMYLGQDIPDAVGNYETPNRLNTKLLSHRVDVIVPKVAMRTEWGGKVTPENVWQEYPRPELKRENWTNLNGLWDYGVTAKSASAPPREWDGRILVPFAIEAPLSGVQKRFTPDDALWYRRVFVATKKAGKRVLLNFEAVDYQCTVWVNDIEVGSHTGGNLPFSFDITRAKALKDGENTLLVRVTDATDSAYQLHGKQRLDPKGIWYTPVSGIWQTVWMEEVPDDYVSQEGVWCKTELDGSVVLRIRVNGSTGTINTKIVASLAGKTVFEEDGYTGDRKFKIPNPKLWSPDSPTLYDLRIEYGEDVVETYFAFRETAIAKDSDGHLRLHLNGKPIFHWGTLDQGWWPDGLLTPPSDAAMLSDIAFLKAAGFNTIRKHIKVEPRRYYYHCDRLGMMMWQDQVSAMTDNPKWTRLQPDPAEKTWPADAHLHFMTELRQMIDHLHNHPCIVQWVPFNEAWGQHQTKEVVDWVVGYDPTRQVNAASGGNWFPAGHIVDEHRYPHPGFPFELGEGGRFDGFVKVVGEFGGHGFPVEGHLWNPDTKNWGYGGLPKDKAEWLDRYKDSIRILADLKRQGIAAGIYTQTSDVEGEINGLITYDRKVQKLKPEELREIGNALFE